MVRSGIGDIDEDRGSAGWVIVTASPSMSTTQHFQKELAGQAG